MEAASAELLAQQTGAHTPRTEALGRKGATVGARQGEYSNRHQKNHFIFCPRNETLELNEEPRKQVGHERGKFAS